MKLLRRLSAILAAFLLAISLPCQVVPATPPAVATKPAVAIEQPLLWRIELPTPSYLYGTIHLPDERVTTLPKVVTEAIDSCGALFTEVPMELDKMMGVAQAAMLPNGTKLVDLIGEELYERMETYVESRGQRMVMFDRVKPWVATTQLMVVDMLKKMATEQPLDLKLYTDAKKAGKITGGLETVESQLAVFADLDLEEQRSMLIATLSQLEKEAAKGKNPTEELLLVYLRGDEAALDKMVNDYPLGDAELSEKLKTRLLGGRNVGMVDRIVEQLQRHPERGSFFAVGAAHYGGELGIVKLLRDRGYRVTRLELDPREGAQKVEAEAIEGEITRRQQEIEALRARRAKFLQWR